MIEAFPAARGASGRLLGQTRRHHQQVSRRRSTFVVSQEGRSAYRRSAGSLSSLKLSPSSLDDNDRVRSYAALATVDSAQIGANDVTWEKIVLKQSLGVRASPG
jgi:hypothetical protein